MFGFLMSWWSHHIVSYLSQFSRLHLGCNAYYPCKPIPVQLENFQKCYVWQPQFSRWLFIRKKNFENLSLLIFSPNRFLGQNCATKNTFRCIAQRDALVFVMLLHLSKEMLGKFDKFRLTKTVFLNHSADGMILSMKFWCWGCTKADVWL